MMEPIRTIDVAVQFASGISPWWLVLLVPAALAAVWFLYRRPAAVAPRPSRIGLPVLRLAITACVAILIFRPSLILRERLTYPGRVVIVEDDSESMGVVDNRLPVAEAAVLARALGQEAGDAYWQSLADTFTAARRESVAHVRRAAASAERGRAFWDAAEAGQRETTVALDRVVAGIEARRASVAETVDWDALVAQVTVCREHLPLIFSGEQPSSEAVAVFGRSAAAAEQILRALQAHADEQGYARNPVVRQAVDGVRGLTRGEQIRLFIERHERRWRQALPGLTLQRLRLSDVAGVAAGGARGADIRFETAAADAIRGLIEAEHPFPLAAVALVGDGQDWSAADAADVAQLAVRGQVPLCAIGVGGVDEPADLAVTSVRAAPFGVVGEPLTVRVGLKTAWPEAVPVQVELLQGSALVAQASLTTAAAHTNLSLTFTPAEAGLFRLSARITALSGEAVPERNNQMDLAVQVREDRVRVLVLDEEPRWETRFFLNILQRLDYLDLNPVVVITSPDGVLGRGNGVGLFPDTPEALALYDVVVLGDLATGTLQDEEWQRLRDYAEAGGTLCLIAPEQGGYHAPEAWLRALSPLAADVQGRAAVDVQQLAGLPDGERHPLTRAFAARSRAAACADPGLLPETLLLAGTGERALVTARFTGKGKVALLDTDALWRLNAERLGAHAELVIQLVSWAIQGRMPEAGQAVPDVRVAAATAGLQVWVPSGVGSVEAIDSAGQTVARGSVRVREGALFGVVAFPLLPAADIRFKVAGGAAGEDAAVVLDQSRELHTLARNDPWLQQLVSGTEGAFSVLAEAAEWISLVAPKERVETRERVWRLWDSPWVLALLALALAVEWIWRKLAGLV